MNRENRFRGSKNLYRLKNADAAEVYLQDKEQKIVRVKRTLLGVALLPVRFALTLCYSIFFLSFILASEEVAAFGLSLGNFAVQNVEIENNVLVSREAILSALKIQPTANILTCDLDELRGRIQGLSNVKGVEIRRILPGNLLIELSERIPSFRIGEGGVLVDPDGKAVIVKAGNNFFRNLPLLKGIKMNASTGDVMEADRERYANALRLSGGFLKIFGNTSVRFTSLELFEEYADFQLESGLVVRAPLNADTAVFERLLIVLNDLQRKGNTATSIDLQFKDVVVKL